MERRHLKERQIANGFPLDNPPNPHTDMQSVNNEPGYNGSTNKKVFLATDGGIYHTDDITTALGQIYPTNTPSGWTAMNNKLQTTQYFAVSGDASSGSPIIFGGLMDNGSLRLIGQSPDAAFLLGGDGGESTVDGTDCFGQDNFFNYGRMLRFNNCAASSPGPLSVIAEPANPTIGGDYPAGFTPMITNPAPNDPERAFLGVKSVWRTANVKNGNPVAWFKIKSNSTSTEVKDISVAPSNSNYMWVSENVGNQLGNLYRSTNALATSTATPTWRKVDEDSNGLPLLPNREITKILIDQSSSSNPDQTVYVAFGGFAFDNLYRTTNNGDTWQDISGGARLQGACSPTDPTVGLPCAPIRAVARHPYNANILYVGTEIGIYVTSNATASPGAITWIPVTEGPANVSISELTFIKVTHLHTPTTLLAGTYGRGLWTLNLATPAPTAIDPGKAVNDFDGDGRSDIAVVREDGSQLVWHKDGSTEGYASGEFGMAGDRIAAADYDGDGKTDMAVYRASDTHWYSLMSSTNTVSTTALGAVEDKTASADFDGDQVADEAVFRPSTGDWHVEQSEDGHLDFHWGAANDTPVSVDFSGDGKADFGVFHEAQGMIALSYYDGSTTHNKQFGLEGDIPVSGDYDGDGKADIAFWRPDDDGDGNGCWYITYATNGFAGYDSIPWGESGDVPVPGDYDGDGKMDVAVWRASSGFWHILESSNGYFSQQFGAAGDTPVGSTQIAQASRPGNGSFTRAPSWAEPKRRVNHPDKSDVTATD